VVKTLQVRQQGRLRELHRLWCWPQRSSHGRDQLGYRSCTLTRGPAPKSTQPCFMSQPSLSYFFLRKPRGEVLKKLVLTFLGVERWTPRPFTKRASRVVRRHLSRLSGKRARLACCVTRLAGHTLGAFQWGRRKERARRPNSPNTSHRSVIIRRYRLRTPAGDS
jgi:hypothetical protein